MNVWVVTPYEPLPILSPSVRSFRCGMLAKALLSAGHRVVFWTSTFDHFKRQDVESVLPPDQDGNLRMEYLQGPGYGKRTYVRRLFHNRRLAASFLDLAKKAKDRADIIYVQIPTLELAESVVAFAEPYRIPVVVDIRDLWPDTYSRLLPSILRRFAGSLFATEYSRLSRILSASASITAVSKTYLEWADRHSSRKLSGKDRVFYLGFPDNVCRHKNKRKDIRSQYGIPENSFLVVFAGTFCPSFALKTIRCAAVKLLNSSKQDIHYVLAGDGEGYDDFKKHCSGVSNITLTGRLSPGILSDLLSASDAGLAPYSSDAMMSLPNKPFEYMAAGLPMIFSLKGELRELVAKYSVGIYYDADSADSLIRAVTQLAGNPNLANVMGMASKKVFNEKFSSSIIYSDYVKHMQSLVNC